MNNTGYNEVNFIPSFHIIQCFQPDAECKRWRMQMKGRDTRRRTENRQMSEAQANPCLLKHNVPKAASSSGDPKLLAAEIQDDVQVTLYLLCFSYLSLDCC